jgi:hypothetical protein
MATAVLHQQQNTSATNAPMLRQNLEPKSAVSVSTSSAAIGGRVGVVTSGVKGVVGGGNSAVNGPVKPLLPFNVTPPKPSGTHPFYYYFIMNTFHIFF